MSGGINRVPGVLVEWDNGPKNQGRGLLLPFMLWVRWHKYKGYQGCKEV